VDAPGVRGALAVLDEVEKLMPNCPGCRPVFRGAIVEVPVKQVRGVGLMVGVELAGESKPVIAKMAERGLLGVIAGTNVIRFLPALNRRARKWTRRCAS